MKQLNYSVIFSLSFLLLFCACKDDTITYAEELKAEQKLIKDFIKRENIQVVNNLPSAFPWPEKVYYKSITGLYYRLTNQGEFQSKDSIKPGDVVVVRYDQYTLTSESDTISSQSTVNFPYPKEFKYLDYTQACIAWHEASSYMKYNNSEAQIIVPSKLSFSQFSRPATPIGYDMAIRIKKF